jgi:hypothetical protein
MLSSLGLAFVGLCLVQLRIYLLVGGRVVVLGALLCGKWCLFVLCGVFGESKMLDVSRILRDLVRSFSTFFFLSYSPGLRAGWPCG